MPRTRAIYDQPIPSYGDLMTVDRFRYLVKAGKFIDYDGYGHPARGNQCDARIVTYPSEVEYIPHDATHIIWFNR